MTTVLIADAIKPSLVMSSEVFKDKIPGAEVIVAATGEEAVRLAEERRPDLCLVDFDLPDVDGPALVIALRKVYSGPILMTAFPDKNVEQAVNDHLFAFNDASAWIRKPVKFDELSAQIDKFLIERQRTGRRFSTDLPMQLIAKASGRGKRAPKASGTVLNISLGGACIQLESNMRMKKKQELTLSITIPDLSIEFQKTRAVRGKSVRDDSTTKVSTKASETKIKATVAWMTKEGQVGLKFEKLTDLQQKGLEIFLRSEAS
jgi:DNA-binding response OmpR family regulator